MKMSRRSEKERKKANNREKKDENHQRTLQNCKNKRYRAPKKPE